MELNRRDMLLGGAGALLTMAAAGEALAQGGAHDHAMHAQGPGGKERAVLDAAMACQKEGQLCIEHCIHLFKMNDTSVAECADRVQEMVAMCGALAQLAAFASPHLKAAAQVCADICASCEQECRKHATKHAPCKACADSCVTCIKACRALAA